MKNALIAGLLVAAIIGFARASTVIKNDQVINATGISTSTVFTQVLDLGQADSASFQTNFTCAKGSVTILASNLNSSGFVSLNVAGSSITVSAVSTSTLSNQQFSIANPPYRYYQFSVTNSSAAVGQTSAPCSVSVTECIKSLTVTSN